MMKTLVKVLFLAALLLLAAGLVAPGFVNWNPHKDRIAAVLEKRLARDISIGGNVGFRIIPQPRLSLEDVTVSSGAGQAPLLTLKRLDARILFMPLLQGRFEIENVSLEGPRLFLEVDTAGKENWKGIFREKAAPGRGGAGISAASFSFKQVRIADGAVSYVNRATGTERGAEGINLSVSAATLLGPYHAAGRVKYQGSDVGVSLASGVADREGHIPLTFSLQPSESLPQVKFDGTVDIVPAFALQGEVETAQGPLAALTGDAFLRRIGPLEKPAVMTATLTLRDGAARFENIRATVEGGGAFSGSAGVVFTEGKRPVVAAELEGEKLALSAPSGLPQGFDLSLTLKGKDVTWEGTKIAEVELSADATDKDWAISRLRARMPGKSDIRLAGVATPGSGVSRLALQFDTEDFGKMMAALPLDRHNALRQFAGAGIVKKMKFSSDFDLRNNNISLSSIKAQADGTMKISGSLDVARGTSRPAYVARLKIDGFDAGGDGVAALLKTLPDAEGDLSLDIRNFSMGSVRAGEVKISAHTDSSGVAVKRFDGIVSDTEAFSFTGQAATLAPLDKFDFSYAVRTADGAAFAQAFGLPLPPPVVTWKNADLSGRVNGSAGQYAFSVAGKLNGGDVTFDGTFDGAAGYRIALHLARPAGGGALTALPAENILFVQNGGVELDGDLAGTAGDYTISNIRTRLGASPLAGSVTMKGDVCTADFSVGQINLDKWRWSDWTSGGGMGLTLRGESLVWKGLTAEQPRLVMEVGAESVTITGLSGKLWGGDLALAGGAKKDGSSWRTTLKGALNGGDLGPLAGAIGARGIGLGRGSLDFDVAADGPGFFGALAAVSGSLRVKAAGLTVEGFTPEDAVAALARLAHPVSDFQRLVNAALKDKGKGAYADIDIPVIFTRGRASFGDVTLAGPTHKAGVTAGLDIATGRYDLKADVRLSSLEGAPAISVHRADALKKSGDYAVDIAGLGAWIAKKFPPPSSAPVPPAAGGDAVRGIMQRLDDDAEGQVE